MSADLHRTTMVFTKKALSWISERFAGTSKSTVKGSRETKSDRCIPLSKIQTLPAELKLQILENAPDILAVRNLLIACPGFYPVYCKNRYEVLLKVLQASLGTVTDLWAIVVLNIHLLDVADPLGRARAGQLWRMGERLAWVQDRDRFIDTRPSLSDLLRISKMYYWVMQKSEKYSRLATEPNIVRFTRWETDKTQALYACFYLIEVFAALTCEKDRGWAAASRRTTHREKALLYSWDAYDIDMMSQIVKVLWPNRFWGTLPCRRRTRVLLVRDARPRRWEDISYD